MSHSEEQAPYRTRDLTEASFLASRGYSYKLAREGYQGRHPIAEWHFSDPTGNIQADIQDFADGEARIEPVRFQRKLTEVRRELYDFLGIKRGRKE